MPSSVAQVSAFTVAMIPKNKGNQTGAGATVLRNATNAPTPPLARAWAKSRRWLLSNFSAASRFSASLKYERRLEVTKNTASSRPHVHPPKPKVSVPTRIAPATPEGDS